MIYPYRGDYRITQKFGKNPDRYKKFGLLGHNGIDIGLPMKTQVIAPHGGTVIEATFDPSGYGNYIKIVNEKEGSVLAHLSSFQVKVGETVSEGEPVALSGNSGNSTGPHLHWGYFKFPRDRKNGYAGFIDQLPLIAVPTNDLQKELDACRISRDSHWNDLTIAKLKIIKQQEEIEKLRSKISKAISILV